MSLPNSAISQELSVELDSLTARRPLAEKKLQDAAIVLSQGQLDQAISLLQGYLAKMPRDPDALHLQAQALFANSHFAEAEDTYLDCIAVAPDFDAARFRYAKALLQLNKPHEALAQLELLLDREPDNILYRDLKAAIFAKLGKYTEWAECYRQLTAERPKSPLFWMNYAYALRTIGEQEACIAAFRKAIELSPALGGAYWSLSDLKTFRFDDADIASIEAQLLRSDLSSENRTYFHFALAKAYADQKSYGNAFRQYATANALRRIGIDYDPGVYSEFVRTCEFLFTREFLEERCAKGSDSRAPIFVVGMQRAGSTLLEHMLSSHSMIEGLGELPEIPLLATRLENDRGPACGMTYPQVVGALGGNELSQFGNDYVTSVSRRQTHGTPFFVDKHPYNFLSTGLIHLILPNAKIVDIRRHPLACCFSNFTMNFGIGLQHTYRLSDLGRYYADYVRLMAHYDSVLPGRIHRVFYENLVADPERELRSLFRFLDLPFESRCLDFHTTVRAVMTASSEQVRRPINEDGVDRWRNYEPWLGPLKAALGPVLDAYPDVPAFGN